MQNEFKDTTTHANEMFDQKKYYCLKKLHFFFLASFFVCLPFNRELVAIVFS